jgi:hypothetical protein
LQQTKLHSFNKYTKWSDFTHRLPDKDIACSIDAHPVKISLVIEKKMLQRKYEVSTTHKLNQ